MTKNNREKTNAVVAGGAGATVGGATGATVGVLTLAAQGLATELAAGLVIGGGAAVGALAGYGVYRLFRKVRGPKKEGGSVR